MKEIISFWFVWAVSLVCVCMGENSVSVEFK